MKKLYQYKSISDVVTDVDVKSRTVSGYFSAFDKVDSYGDVVVKGAFAKTIKEQGPESQRPRIKHILNHDITSPIGKIIELKEDNYGLFYRSVVGTHNLGEDFIKMVDSGLITEHSFGYKVIREQQQQKGNEVVNVLHELKMYEGSSLTGWGVNQYTPMLGLAKGDVDVMQQRVKKLEAFVKSATVTDETIELLMLEIKQQSQLIAELMQTTPAAKAQEPEQPQQQKLDAGLILTYLSL